ncbi:MAG: GTPase HflX [Lentisphaerae bacterium GWF2_45_14]|nr:MAG: GTPase HflX [Lentisphaerae bacterium GWF2_45_14]
MIDTEKDNSRAVERALLVGIQEPGAELSEAEEHLEELGELTNTLGIPTIDKIMVKLRRNSPKYLVGDGKASEILDIVKEKNADCLVFDCELSPSQQKNLTELTKVCVIDRQEVIIDIFASRASTKEAVLQIDLARFQYMLPRLTRAWTHLSRQRGGALGNKGEGEQQIEIDRRILKQKISQLQKELADVKEQRKTQRKKRERSGIPHAAIVGYTNAGKSSLLNALTGSGVFVEDKLFATLDPTTRKLLLPDSRELLLTDTVGFIRKLPHNLVEAFKSTLEEAVLADFLLIVVDLSSPFAEDYLQTTFSVLRELGAEDKESVVLFNKVDLGRDPVRVASLKPLVKEHVLISVKTGEGLDKLLEILSRKVAVDSEIMRLRIPPERHDIAALLHHKAKVLDKTYDDDGFIIMTVNIKSSVKSMFAAFAKD